MIEACYRLMDEQRNRPELSLYLQTLELRLNNVDELKDRTFDSAYVLLISSSPYWRSTHLIVL